MFIVGSTLSCTYLLLHGMKHPQYVLGNWVDSTVSCVMPGFHSCYETNGKRCCSHVVLNKKLTSLPPDSDRIVRGHLNLKEQLLIHESKCLLFIEKYCLLLFALLLNKV